LTAFFSRNSFFDDAGGAYGASAMEQPRTRMKDATTAVPTDSPADRIEEVLSSLRPAIRADGGDIELVDFDEESGVVRIRMVGACYACPMSSLTLKAGIEQRLRMLIPEVRSVESVENG
jgi:Fe-S cluster biogenesis protein NfuA